MSAAQFYSQQAYYYTVYPLQIDPKLSEFVPVVDGGKSQNLRGRNHYQNNLHSKAWHLTELNIYAFYRDN